jgi:hypothetical protein
MAGIPMSTYKGYPKESSGEIHSRFIHPILTRCSKNWKVGGEVIEQVTISLSETDL